MPDRAGRKSLTSFLLNGRMGIQKAARRDNESSSLPAYTPKSSAFFHRYCLKVKNTLAKSDGNSSANFLLTL